MKHFLYIEQQDGGMVTHDIFCDDDFYQIPGWMKPGCQREDKRLLSLYNRAVVGDCFAHRLGLLIRLKDQSD